MVLKKDQMKVSSQPWLVLPESIHRRSLTCLGEGRFAQAVIDNVEKAKSVTDNGA